MSPGFRGRIYQQNEYIDSFERCSNFAHHLFIQCGFRVVQSRRIDQHHLRIFTADNTLNAIAGGLRLRSHNGNLLSHQPVHQCAFPGIRTPHNRHKSRTVSGSSFLFGFAHHLPSRLRHSRTLRINSGSPSLTSALSRLGTLYNSAAASSFPETETFTRRASPCPTTSESSRATLSADWLPAPQIETPANRISLPELELSRSRGSAVPQSSSPFHPPILRSARPASLPHLRSPCYHASPAKWFLPAPFPVSDACHLLRPRPRFLPPGLPSSRSPRRFHAHQ